MIKLQDFASQVGVTERQIQRLLKKYEEELEGLYERKGPNGTWLTEEACEILRSKMRQQPMAVSDAQTVRELEKLRKEKEQLLQKVAVQADKVSELAQWKADNAVAIASAAQTQLLLETTRAELDQAKLDLAAQDAQMQEVRANAQRAIQDARDAQERAEEQRQRAEAAEAKLAELAAMPKWKKFLIGWKGGGHV